MRHCLIIITVLILMTIGCKEQAAPNDSKATFLPKGGKAPASNFTGTVYLYPLSADDSVFHCVMGSVTFEPGARSNWHTHPAGQILVITSGVCYHQIKGEPGGIFHSGDTIKCPPDVAHWHGASPDGSMTHIAVNPNTQKGVVTWLQPVTDVEYNSTRKD